MASNNLRSFRIDEDIWKQARVRAASEGTTVSALLVAWLRSYIGLPSIAPQPAPVAPEAPSAIRGEFSGPPAGEPGDGNRRTAGAPADPEVTAAPAARRTRRESSRKTPCPHPKARVNKGLCGACGQHAG